MRDNAKLSFIVRGNEVMAVEKRYQSDNEAILEKRYDNCWNFWTTPDKRFMKGSPFSTLESALLLRELGMEPS